MNLKKVGDRPAFRRLSLERNCLGALLAVIMAALYFTFICVVAFSPATLAAPVYAGSVISLGVVLGVALMVSGLVLTAIYVAYASLRIDPMVSSLGKEVQ
jgi:uncharacterized membrane protein (DUF485 family)